MDDERVNKLQKENEQLIGMVDVLHRTVWMLTFLTFVIVFVIFNEQDDVVFHVLMWSFTLLWGYSIACLGVRDDKSAHVKVERVERFCAFIVLVEKGLLFLPVVVGFALGYVDPTKLSPKLLAQLQNAVLLCFVYFLMVYAMLSMLLAPFWYFIKIFFYAPI